MADETDRLYEESLHAYLKLENENAELKEEMKAKQVVLNDFRSRVETVTARFNAKSSQLTKAKELMQKLIANAPDTYSGTNIELQQKKMFSFQDAVNKAEQFLKDSEVGK